MRICKRANQLSDKLRIGADLSFVYRCRKRVLYWQLEFHTGTEFSCQLTIRNL